MFFQEKPVKKTHGQSSFSSSFETFGIFWEFGSRYVYCCCLLPVSTICNFKITTDILLYLLLVKVEIWEKETALPTMQAYTTMFPILKYTTSTRCKEAKIREYEKCDIWSTNSSSCQSGSLLVNWQKQNKISIFSNLGEISEDSDQVSFDGAIKSFVTRHLVKLQERFCQYFPHLDTQTVSWIVKLFLCNVSKVPKNPEGLAEELLKLHCNNEARIAFEFEQCLQSFWMCRAVRPVQ